MDFCDLYKKMDYAAIKEEIYQKEESDVEAALEKERITRDDFLALLSPKALGYIEDMAQRAHRITMRRFGNVMNLYAPLYLSNECTNSCVYCGFNTMNDVARVTLSEEETMKEADILYGTGIRDILLVSGEAPGIVTMEYIKRIISRLHVKFHSIAVEIYPMSADEYEQIERLGCDGLTVYQETYDSRLYEKLHLKGKKRDFLYRLETPERGGAARLRRLGTGILMGLADWRADCAFLAAHASYLTRKYWMSKVSVSFPRLRPAYGGFAPMTQVTDIDLVQAVTAFRIYMNDIGIVLSTREKPSLRDNLARLGITQMSAGSRTNPGGYSHGTGSCEQFEVEDGRSPASVSKALADLGYDPVFKDWEKKLC